jgi:hypothetical protein
MTHLRTAVDRCRHSHHEADGRAPARASRRGFGRSEGGPHADELSGVKCLGGAVGSVDAGFAAGSVLTSVRGRRRLVSRAVSVAGAAVKAETAGRGAQVNERLTTG